MKYFDVHAHIFPPNIAGKVIDALESYYGYAWEGTGLEEDLLAGMDAAGVERTVVFSSATKPEQVVAINNYLAGAQRAHPDRFYAFGTLHPAYAEFRGEIARMRDLGLHGLKFHPDFQKFLIDDPRMMKIYECIGSSMPVLFHIGDYRTEYSSPERLARVIAEFPELKVIAAHLGGYSEWDEAWKHLIGKPLWLDTSSCVPRLPVAEARKIILAHGIDRVLFASDYPAVRAQQAIDDVRSFGFSAGENDKIFHRNAEKLFGMA